MIPDSTARLLMARGLVRQVEPEPEQDDDNQDDEITGKKRKRNK